MSTYTLRVAINGEETDTLVEGDNADWDCKLGYIRISGGGGSFLREAANLQCTFNAYIPSNVAPLVRTITVAVQGPATNPESYWHDNGDGTYYRIVFHGTVNSSKVSRIGQGFVQFVAMDEMQGLFERRAHTALSNNSGPRTLTNDIESAHSITVNNGNPMIPQAADFYNLDRPKQESASNGEWLRTAMAGTGMSIVGEWEGTITAPELCWRTDRNWSPSGGGNYSFLCVAWRPWEYSYPDVGTVWRDFVARVEVNGEVGNSLTHHGYVRYSSLRHMQPRQPTKIVDVSNGTRYWGRADLASAGMRNKLGNQTASFASWIDTAAECEDAAKFIARHVGEPSYMRMNRVGFSPDRLHASADADTGFTEDVDDFGMYHAVLMLGDQIEVRGHGNFGDDNGLGGDNTGGLWPDSCPEGSDTYDELQALWEPTLDSDSNPVTPQYHNVRTIIREWTPSAGWNMEVGLEPDALIAAVGFDLDHGTY